MSISVTQAEKWAAWQLIEKIVKGLAYRAIPREGDECLSWVRMTFVERFRASTPAFHVHTSKFLILEFLQKKSRRRKILFKNFGFDDESNEWPVEALDDIGSDIDQSIYHQSVQRSYADDDEFCGDNDAIPDTCVLPDLQVEAARLNNIMKSMLTPNEYKAFLDHVDGNTISAIEREHGVCWRTVRSKVDRIAMGLEPSDHEGAR